VIAAAGLDLLVGDPRWCPHPVVAMGRVITQLREWIEAWAGDRPFPLRAGGGLITFVLVLGSGGMGWLLERLILPPSPLPQSLAALLLVIALASALAARSLRDSVLAVLQALPDLHSARERLSWIVGRDVSQLDQDGILRASAETASENAVDGLFAPLFWMLIGAGLWKAGFSQGPGPLAMAWAFKASSTLDSMLGYRKGRLRWLGTAGAKLDDLLTWLPCRLVLITLPLVSLNLTQWSATVRAAVMDGTPDPSPNAGLSESIFAHCADVQLGGLNRYGKTWINKPLLSAQSGKATAAGVRKMLNLGLKLEAAWLVVAAGWWFVQ
jgi:adenosylcobinamide-phosphate synthase